MHISSSNGDDITLKSKTFIQSLIFLYRFAMRRYHITPQSFYCLLILSELLACLSVRYFTALNFLWPIYDNATPGCASYCN